MGDLSNVWLPPNGFDHASFHVFIDIPDKSGSNILPKINATAPPGFEWDYLFYAAGWNAAFYDSKGASENYYGSILTPTPSIISDKENKKITFLFPPDALDNPTSLEGAKIYISTWDSTGSEGGHRSISKAGGAYEFGGSDNLKAILILDDIEVITIPNK